ncbi:MAG: HKD family nuclease, partial [Selenomonadaceae bacterium]|nr:HKD family nuclease [Selenomonadaceae bacterium]
ATGDKGMERQLIYQLNMCIRKANKIDVIVSFLMTSGVKLLINQLKKAVERGASLRILTGNYLGIT